jgi:hypothetical protein
MVIFICAFLFFWSLFNFLVKINNRFIGLFK